MTPRLVPLAIAAALIAVIAGCGSQAPAHQATATSPPPRVAAARTTASHVVVIVMENKEYGQVAGSPSSPYANALARRYALATRFYGVTHPSLPNYLALTAGTTFGVTSDCSDCQQHGRNIADQLDAAKLSWKAYMGGMPSACFKGAASGQYAKKHDPFMYFDAIAGNRSRCRRVVPERQLTADLRAKRLPSFSFLAPGLCDDTHDCPVASGDRYLSRMVPPILRALGPDGFLVVTYDEGTTAAGCCGGLAKGGRIPTVIAGPGVRRGARLTAAYSHYSTLRTIEDAFALAHLGNAGSRSTSPLSAAFEHGTPRLR